MADLNVVAGENRHMERDIGSSRRGVRATASQREWALALVADRLRLRRMDHDPDRPASGPGNSQGTVRRDRP